MANCKWRNWAKSLGFELIAGADEAGRGPLAGPVVASVCMLPEDHTIEGIDDSKLLTQEERESLFKQIIAYPGVIYGIGMVEVEMIDKINILQATFQAMRLALEAMVIQPTYLFVDGKLPIPRITVLQKPLVGGDADCECIGAASILAKYTRDKKMDELHNQYPQYGFDSNKGYGTAGHLKALQQYGPCSHHRLSFEPVKSMAGQRAHSMDREQKRVLI